MRLLILMTTLLLTIPMFGQFKITSTTTTPLCGQPECEEEARLKDSLNNVRLLAQKASTTPKTIKVFDKKDSKTNTPAPRFEDYIDASDLLAYAAMEENKAENSAQFQLLKSKIYFLETSNMIFFIPESYTTKAVASITTPFLGLHEKSSTNDMVLSDSYLEDLTLPFRTNGTSLLHEMMD